MSQMTFVQQTHYRGQLQLHSLFPSWIHPIVDDDIDRSLEDDVPTGAFVSLVEKDGAGARPRLEDEDGGQFPLHHRRQMRQRL